MRMVVNLVSNASEHLGEVNAHRPSTVLKAVVMIITCPECATRCVVDREAIGAEGRRVTCGACGSEWFQLAEAALRGASSESFSAADDDAAALAGGYSNGGHFNRGGGEPHRRGDAGHGAPITAVAALGGPSPRTALVGPSQMDQGFYGSQSRGYGAQFDQGYNSAAPAPRRTAAWVKALGGFAAVVVAGAFGAVLTAALTAPKGSSFDIAAMVSPLFETVERSIIAGGAPDGMVFVAHGFDVVERPEGPALEIWGRVANNGAADAYAPLVEIVSRDGVDAELQRWTARLEAPVLKPGESARFASRMMYPIGPVSAVDLAFREH